PGKPYSLLVTRDGTLWIGTFAGLASLKDGKLTRYPEVGELFVTSLLEDREGTVWAGILFDAPDSKTVGCAQSEAATRSATGRTALSPHSFGAWVRTARALSGSARSPEFCDGSLALGGSMRCRECGSAT
ncbi:MAG: two-component regulator propeller domain-containing protein, partial [Gammaproteobacteria bacterium]